MHSVKYAANINMKAYNLNQAMIMATSSEFLCTSCKITYILDEGKDDNKLSYSLCRCRNNHSQAKPPSNNTTISMSLHYLKTHINIQTKCKLK
jgi:hypothetical protein